MYRLCQFVGALMASVQGKEWVLVEGLLAPSQCGLFQSMPWCDQRHGADLVRALQRKGYRDLALLQAALLHDVGKVGQLRLWHRVAVVLLGWFAPGGLRRLAEGRPGSWRYPFFVHLNYAQLGAKRVRKTGCDCMVVDLIRRHHEPLLAPAGCGQDQLLAALQAADRRA